jgi:hypothetical protein
MSFKVYIYYCALCGGWAAFLAWGAVAVLMAGNAIPPDSKVFESGVIGAVLGFFVAAAIGFVDAVLNAVGMQRFVRVMTCGFLGLVGGAIGGTIGGFVVKQSGNTFLAFPGWVLVGTLIGGSIGVFDVVRAVTSGEDSRAASKKLLNGIYGGLLGGVVGGLPFTLIYSSTKLSDLVPNARLTAGLVLLGACIGLMIGLAQVILKQAWVRVEEGFRAGREILLTKDETTIGRAESCDLGLFGDNSIEKVHARIVLKNNRYLLAHVADEGETLLNDEPVNRPVPLRAGDLIRVGRSVLSFGEKEKRRG